MTVERECIGDDFVFELVKRVDEITSRERYAANRDRIIGKLAYELKKLAKPMARETRRQFTDGFF